MRNKDFALITGASEGFGKALALECAARNMNLVLVALPGSGLSSLSCYIERNFNVTTYCLEHDLSKKEECYDLFNEINRLQIQVNTLINNAGIYGGYPQAALDASIDQFKAAYDANVYGVVRVTQAFIDLLKKSSTPRIVNVSSSQGSITLHSDPSYKYYDYKGVVYLSSKSAMNMYTVVLAYDLKDSNFKINAVCPGYTKTDFNGHRGPGSVEDAGIRILKYALLDKDGPTGKFFSEENNPETFEIPW